MVDSAQHDLDLYAGRILGPYELTMPIGSGGTAHVWAARHFDDGRIVALKMLKPELAESADFRDMFFDEARIASRIEHENVARTYQLTEIGGILTLVMEWIDGGSLLRMIRPRSGKRDDAPTVALPIRHAVKILSETCAGLHAAHELRDNDGKLLAVVHRDVSPHNILVTRDGRVKVTDFGIAKALGKSHRTLTGQIKGKLPYMSPEQLLGAGRIDRRSDVFSLGTVLYEATTGQRPFNGGHDPELMAAIIDGRCKPPSSLVRNYPPSLEAILARAMSPAVDGRYASALELKAALDTWLAEGGPSIGAAQIANMLSERCGAELDRRSAAVTAQAKRASFPDAAVRTAASFPPVAETARRQQHPPDGVSMTAAAGAVFVGLVLGLAVLGYVHHVRADRRASLRGRTLPHVMEVAKTSTDVPKVDTPEPVMLELASSTEVTLVVPDDARIFVDGRALPDGERRVQRPQSGSIHVLVKSEGRHERWIEVTPGAPNEIEVPLAAKHKPNPRSTRSGVTVPPNPYE